jgi:hypothetical protein
MHPEVSKARARVAALSRGVRAGERTPEELAIAQRELQTAKNTAYIEQVVSRAPSFTDDQRTRLAELLRPVRQGGAA